MNSTRIAIVALAASVFLRPESSAAFTSRNSLGLGFTDNAYLTKESQVSDTYFQIASANTFQPGEHTPRLRLAYTDYSKVQSNDLFGIRLSDSWRAGEPATMPWELSAALVGNFYTAGSPGTSETAFTNEGVDFKATRSAEVSEKTTFDYGAGYRGRYYSSFNGRFDNTFFGSVALDYEATPRLRLGASSEAGGLFSTLSDYSLVYFDVGGNVNYTLPARWELSADLLLSQSLFTNRTISTTTEVTRRRGDVVRVGSVATNESYSTTTLSAELERRQTDAFTWGLSLTATNQASKSGLRDYSSLDALAQIAVTF